MESVGYIFSRIIIYSFPPSRLLTSSCFNFNETSILKIQVRAQSIRCNTFWVVAYWDQALTGLDPWFFEVRLLKHPLWVASVPPSQHLFQGNNAEIRAVFFEIWMVNSLPIGSMYAISGNIYHQSTPNVSIHTSTMDPAWARKFCRSQPQSLADTAATEVFSLNRCDANFKSLVCRTQSSEVELLGGGRGLNGGARNIL